MPRKIAVIDLKRLAEAVRVIQQRGFKVTQKAVARELRVDEYWFSHMLRDHPRIRAVYKIITIHTARP